MTRACEMAEIDRSTPYTEPWLQDEEFQESLSMAKAMAADHLEAEAIRRAYDGVEEPVGWYQGSPGGTVTKYSDTLMIFLLKGAKPDKYVERHDHTVTPGGVMVVPSDAIPQDWAAHAREQQQALTESAGEEVAKVLPHLGSGDGG